MKNNPLISIIVPVYNIERYIGKCLASLIGQTYENIEIVVIDDGSTDGSGRICDEIAVKDKRIKVFHKKNGGLSDARNYGIKQAKGEIIALVDGDDFVKKKYIEVMVSAMRRGSADVVVCGYNDVRLADKVMSGKKATIGLLVKQENVDIVAWNKLYRKALFVDNNIWYPLGKKHEDALTTYKVYAEAEKVIYVDDVLYDYVEREGSIMNRADEYERLKMREMAAREAIQYFNGDRDLCEAAEVALLTAKFAFVDAGLRGEIAKEHIETNIEWILENTEKYRDNKYLTKRLRLYLRLVRVSHGKGYFAFRKII